MSLWRHSDFLKLWAAQSVSEFGTLVGRFALPLLAVLVLDVSPLGIALLRVADMIPVLLVGLFAGVWVDRLPRRPIMIGADLGRALLLLTIPLAYLLDLLGIWQLFVVALLVGVLSTFFDVAYPSYLPTLLRRDQLVEGNSRLRATGAVVEVAGFGAAGALVQILTAPIAILVDAASFLASALALGLIRRREPPPIPAAERRSAWSDIADGLRLVWREPMLRAFAGAEASSQLFVHMWVAMLTLFLVRHLGIEPWLMGVLYGIGGVSSLFGALLAGRLVARFGLGPTLVTSFFLGTASLTLVPIAGGPILLIVLLVGGQQLFDAAHTIFDINQASLIQTITPDRALGRVNASLRVVRWGAMLVGTLAGGLLGELIGVRETMLLGALGALPSVLWLVASPLPRMHAMPASS